MNIDEAKSLWSNRAGESSEFRGHLDKVRRTERFELTILRRDLVETVTAISVAVFFGSTLPSKTGWIEWLGRLIVVLAAIEIAVVLNIARIRGGRAPVDASMRDYCVHELARTNRQIKLLENVIWWYIGPIAAGIVMIEIGSSGPLLAKLLSIGVIATLCYWVHRINRSAVRSSLVPLKASLEEALASMDEA